MSLKFTNKRKSLALGAVAALMASSMVGCNESSVIGESIVQDNVEVIIDSTFTVSGRTAENNAVLSRTITQLVGEINAPGYGRLSSDVVTQFMPAISLDTTNVGVERVDSMRLVMFVELGAYTGDSIAPMGLDIYRLNKDLPTTMYSDFNPEGYYDSKKLGSVIYNATALGENDTIKAYSYRAFSVNLGKEIAQELYSDYVKNPASFSSPTEFAKVFKGLYFKNSYGSGRVTNIGQTVMRMYYHSTYYDEDAGKDTTTYSVGNYFSVTPEIITNNNISLSIDQSIKDAVSAGDNIVLAPAGLDVELKFPATEIISSYRNNITNLGVINTLSMKIPVEEIENDYGIEPPSYLLMVLKKDKDSFFINNDINDNVTSFYAAYDSTTKSYSFTGLRGYLLDLMAKDEITDEDLTFTLTPVDVETETTTSSYYSTGTTYVTAINPYVEKPAMAKLLLDKAKIWFVYSKQTINY
jgi:hypothetical protein